MSACGMFAGDGPALCGIPAAVSLRTCCVHEHAVERGVCTGHEAELRGKEEAGGTWGCVFCRDASEPHFCLVTLEWVPLEVPA